jgi:predicted nucleic acid-binding Zn ribbon protein
MVSSAELAVDENLRSGWWRRYDDYEIVTDRARTRYVRAKAGPVGPRLRMERAEYVDPLSRRNADLFLQFARWPEDPGMDKAQAKIPSTSIKSLDTDRNADAALQWAQLFGVLGLNGANESISAGGDAYDPTAEYIGLEKHPGPPSRAYRKSDIGGPPNESVENFAYESWEAFVVLRLYEALTDPGGLDLETIRSLMSTRPQSGWDVQDGKVTYGASWTTREREGSEPWQAELWARGVVEGTVQRKIELLCYPTLHQDKGVYSQGWSVKSLLGAMWLQMMWLMLSRPRHCLSCKKALPANARSDKRFCDDTCKGNWNYHNGTGKSNKEARKRAREENAP